ncbi:hypothetical protein DSO57_1003946 [Entomophthora muscae]|uniref:Uncharacterized protein n=1 Tax=Entomophthora muscae TaxID=34485 RepID=A0ACC2RZC9_9FUNG|nr:hypothetical protein DSO57_1003946 [Entomophthora muscae]
MNSLTRAVFALATLSSVLAEPAELTGLTPNWVPLFLGAILIVVGLMFLFAGKCLIHIIASIAGALLLGGGALYAMQTIQKSTQFTLLSTLVVLIAAITGGLIGMCLVSLSIAILGGFVGICLTKLLTSTGLLPTNVAWIVGAIVVSGMFILAYFATDFIIIAFTSVSGAFAVMFGLDFYINTGFRGFVSSFTTSTPDSTVTIMLVSTVILAAIGCLSQFGYNRVRY